MKIEAAGAAFSPCGDRFIPEGYREGIDFETQLNMFSAVKGMCGVPILYPVDYIGEGYEDPVKLKTLFERYNLKVGTVCPDTYTKAEWKNGTLANRDAAARKKMIKIIKEAMDYCREAGGADILLWLAHDGYDYPFEDNYTARWEYLIEGLREVASYRSDVNVTIEYKTKEPRTHQYISDVGKSLLICREIGLPNLGVVLDIGHSLFAGENPAESVALLNMYKKLFHVHLNDNYRSWDDDLLLGSVHFWETLEFFFWLYKIGYEGWYTIDIWPTRVDGAKALKESVDRLEYFMELARNLPFDEIDRMQADNGTMDLMKLLRRAVAKEI